MTLQRKYPGASNFSNWLRQQEAIDSSKGYVTTDVDYIWKNYKTGAWMIIEEKCRMAKPSFCQSEILKMLDKLVWASEGYGKDYYGCHLIQFENTSPDDGKIYIDAELRTKEELIAFVQFEQLEVKNKN
jgi:hypothetical protein